MLSPAAPRSLLALFGAAFVSFALGACGGSGRPPPAQSDEDIDLADLVRYDASAADSRDIFASGACDEGAEQECRIYLPSHNGVQPCFVGRQVCGGAEWGECESGTLVDANASDAELDPEALPPP